MASVGYQARRDEIETYFDRTAADAWAALTSDAPVSRIRRTVRRGRDAMRDTLLNWLPADLTGSTLIDAGCGTGTLAIEAAQRGAEVVAVDLSPTLVNLARERLRDLNQPLDVTFLVGDMRDMDLGSFDYAVAMDSLIHYDVADGVQTSDEAAQLTKLLGIFKVRRSSSASLKEGKAVWPKRMQRVAISVQLPIRARGCHLAGKFDHGLRWHHRVIPAVQRKNLGLDGVAVGIARLVE